MLIGSLLLPLVSAAPSQALSCPGLTGYALSQCMKAERKKKAEELGVDPNDQEAVREEYMKTRQYEQVRLLVNARIFLVYCGPE